MPNSKKKTGTTISKGKTGNMEGNDDLTKATVKEDRICKRV